MSKEELYKKFEENIMFLKKTVPPDDIYMFAEQTLMAAMYFLWKWKEWVDLKEEFKNDPVSAKYITNMLGYIHIRDENIESTIDLGLEDFEDL